MRCFIVALVALVAAKDADVNRPVAKVIKLLEDMRSQLEGEKKSEEDMHDKMACWCDVNGKDKDATVDAAGRKLMELEATIKGMTAKAADLSGSIKKLNDEITANTESLQAASDLRAKEAAEYNAEDKDMLLSIDSLKNALVLLGRTNSFLQMPATGLIEVKTSIKKIINNHDDLIQQILNPTDKTLIAQFVQAGVAVPGYTAQSGEIMGVLKQMLENFQGNLSGATAAEDRARDEFAQLKGAKNEEINSAVDLLKAKEALLAKTNSARAEAKEDAEDTQNSLTADQAFLVDLHQRCDTHEKEWATRSTTRALEIKAVSEALAIITSDDAHDTMTKTFNFMQLNQEENKLRTRVASMLLRRAQRTGSTVLLSLATAVKLDAFEKVNEMIDTMLKDLTKEMADEVKHKDFCNDEFHENDLNTHDNGNSIEDLDAQVNDHASNIDTLQDEIDALSKEIAEMQLQMQRANENRKAENREFQVVIDDQRATQVILTKALDKLGKFYGFVQSKQEPAGPPPPMGSMGAYKSNSGSGGVMSMIQSIITDAANMEKSAITSEQDSETAYENFVHNTNAAVEAAQVSKVDKAATKASEEKAKVQRIADKNDAESQARTLANYNTELHQSCDFVLNNFDARQAARSQEMEGLDAAKAALHTA